MGADLGALLDHHDVDVGVDLLQPDGGGEAGGAGADDHDIEFHRLAGGQLGHRSLSCPQFSTFAHGAAIAHRQVVLDWP